MWILNNTKAVKNATKGEFTSFSFKKTGTTKWFSNVGNTFKEGLRAIDRSVHVQEGVQHSIPNKIVSIGLTGVAAYCSGFPAWFIAIHSGLAIIASAELRRWFIELAMIYPILCIGIFSLPTDSLVTFAVLVAIKVSLEVYCHVADRIIRTLAAWTSDKKHSYYYFWVIGMSLLLSVTQTNPYVQGFFQGLVQGFTGN